MPKVSNLHTRCNMMRKCRAVKSAFNKFKDAVSGIKKFSADDEALIRLTLDNLLTEIRTATEVIKAKGAGRDIPDRAGELLKRRKSG